MTDVPAMQAPESMPTTREGAHGPRKRKLAALLACLALVGTLGWLSLGTDVDEHHPLPSRASRAGNSTLGGNRTAEALANLKAQVRAHFADVLVIVHYNHFRYDVNVDQWEGLYGPYFPNYLVYGPGTWEEAGEAPNYTRMAEIRPYGDYFPGRMPGTTAYNSHYLAIQQNPGWRGYLWVHFDVWMNISSLVRFNKDRVWGPSPACKWQERGLHEECGGWHWCPSTGLEACRKGIEEVHDHWAEWTGEQPGPMFAKCEAAASDALYIPATKVPLYTRVAETFLRQPAFLEVAVPQIARFLDHPDSPNVPWAFHFGINKDDIARIAEEGGACGHPERYGLDLAHSMYLKDPNEVAKLRALVERDLWRLDVGDWEPDLGKGGRGVVGG